MKKLLWICGISLAVILIILSAATLVVKSYLKSDRLKSIIIPKVEELTGRKADIEGISVSIFRGIVIRGISLREREGEGYFIKTREFILDYNLGRLLKKEIVIEKIEIISPYISLRREKDGRYNFSDIRDKLSGDAKEKTEPKGLPFSVIADKVRIRDATVEFKDDLKELPDMIAKADGEISSLIGNDKEKNPPSWRLTIKEMKAVVKGLQTKTDGSIDSSYGSMTISLNTVVDRDVIKLSGTVANYLKRPEARLDIHAKELDLDKILPPAGEKGTAGGKMKQKVAGSQKPLKEKNKQEGMSASGEVKVDAAKYKGYNLKGIHINYRFDYRDNGGIMTAGPLEMQIAGGEKVGMDGNIKGSLRFSYGPGSSDVASGIKRTLTGKGVINLNRCEVKQSKITDAIAIFTGLDDLKRPNFESAVFNWNIRNERLFLDGNMNSNHMTLNPSGNVSFDERIDFTTDLRLSPSLTAKLPAGKVTGYLSDEKGWTVIPLKIGGAMEKPSVKLNPAAMRGVVERGIKGEIEKRLFKTPEKKEERQPAKEGPQDLLKGIFGK